MTAIWGLGPTFPTKIVSYFLAQETGDWFSHFIEVPVLYRSRETVGDTGCELFVDYIQRKAVYLASGDNSVCAVPRNPWDVKSGFILTGDRIRLIGAVLHGSNPKSNRSVALKSVQRMAIEGRMSYEIGVIVCHKLLSFCPSIFDHCSFRRLANHVLLISCHNSKDYQVRTDLGNGKPDLSLPYVSALFFELSDTSVWEGAPLRWPPKGW